MTERLFAAIRQDCAYLHASAVLSVRRREPLAPQFVAGTDMTDWLSHMSPRERELCEAAIESGVWTPEAAE